jgi:hypothetical protein
VGGVDIGDDTSASSPSPTPAAAGTRSPRRPSQRKTLRDGNHGVSTGRRLCDEKIVKQKVLALSSRRTRQSEQRELARALEVSRYGSPKAI